LSGILTLIVARQRELKALEIPTGRVAGGPKAKRAKGFWRSFDS
jgi:hypothetical protein